MHAVSHHPLLPRRSRRASATSSALLVFLVGPSRDGLSPGGLAVKFPASVRFNPPRTRTTSPRATSSATALDRNSSAAGRSRMRDWEYPVSTSWYRRSHAGSFRATWFSSAVTRIYFWRSDNRCPGFIGTSICELLAARSLLQFTAPTGRQRFPVVGPSSVVNARRAGRGEAHGLQRYKQAFHGNVKRRRSPIDTLFSVVRAFRSFASRASAGRGKEAEKRPK
jgi:hypothetical protein